MRVGFIGLGAMGWPMAANLHNKNLLTAVYNRSHEKAMAFAAMHPCKTCENVAELGECEVVVTCVSADDDVTQLVDELKEVLAPDSIVIDCSTIRSTTAMAAAVSLQSAQLHFVDAPVTGGTEGAKAGTLGIMVGAGDEAFLRVIPVFQAMGKTIEHMGPVGSGQATKAANQIACAGINQAVTEALAFAQAHDLPMDKVIHMLSSGAAGNWFLEKRGPTMIKDQYPLGFKVSLHAKDLKICQDMAATFDVRLPTVEMTLIHYDRLLKQEDGDKDISALFQLKRDLFQS